MSDHAGHDTWCQAHSNQRLPVVAPCT
jgi:hypothetical protein